MIEKKPTQCDYDTVKKRQFAIPHRPNHSDLKQGEFYDTRRTRGIFDGWHNDYIEVYDADGKTIMTCHHWRFDDAIQE